MNNLMKHRWFEVWHNPIVWLIFVVCCALSALLIGEAGTGYCTASYCEPMVAGVTYSWLGLFRNSAADLMAPLSILSSLLITMVLGSEFSSRTVNQEITAGHSRVQIFASQCIVGFVIPNAAILLSFFLGNLRWAGKLPMPSAAEAIPFFLRVIVLFSIQDFALFSICMVFLVCFRDIARSSMFSAFSVFTVCMVMVSLEAVLPRAPGTLYPASPSLALLLNPVFLMRYSLYSTLTVSQGICAAFTGIGWAALFLGIASCVFRRCELE